MSSMTTRGYQRRTGERGALDGELDDNPAERLAIWSGHRLHGQFTLSSTTSIVVC